MKTSSKQYATALYETVEDASEKEVEAVVGRFSEVVFRNGDAGKTDDIIKQFEKIWNERNNVTEVEVVSAHKLKPEVVEKIKKNIQEKTKAEKIQIKETVDKKLLGGVLIKYNDYIINFGLRRKIKQFTKTIKK
jgi:F-type H+-transporting ATPase subunit delta